MVIFKNNYVYYIHEIIAIIYISRCGLFQTQSVKFANFRYCIYLLHWNYTRFQSDDLMYAMYKTWICTRYASVQTLENNMCFFELLIDWLHESIWYVKYFTAVFQQYFRTLQAIGEQSCDKWGPLQNY